ncbi:hypothetical protein NUU61_003164 [Penicillium alfredii]|uniref:Basic proline-rich protein n=1 Tax=Penicillium alfredii TaxID=1506179 RepID=A0A9W9FU44_9EURO|nr:uncharacterized protein NUU61_003164 [Penicillium alfredii]KAJ5105817.1 hypothetical protein NUU61_003164 [Penicillium alfredii]
MDGSQRSEPRRSPPSDSREPGVNSGTTPEKVGKEDVMITLSLSPEPPALSRTRSPLTRSHLRSRSLAGIPGMPSMTRAYSSPGLDSRGRYIFVNGRGGSPVESAKRHLPLQMRVDDHLETRMSSLNISETISETAELETAPRSPVPSQPGSSSPIMMPQTLPRAGRLRPTSPFTRIPSIYNEAYPVHSASSASSVPSTPTSLRSRSPSISSLETIPDIPDAEAEEVEEDRIAELKAAADAADAASNANRRRGASDVSSPSSSFNTMRGVSGIYGPRSDKRKRWSVCGAERRQDLDLETIWED